MIYRCAVARKVSSLQDEISAILNSEQAYKGIISFAKANGFRQDIITFRRFTEALEELFNVRLKDLRPSLNTQV